MSNHRIGHEDRRFRPNFALLLHFWSNFALTHAFFNTGASTASLVSNEKPLCFCFGGYTNGVAGYLATDEEYDAGGYEIEWMPVVYGYYEGMLTAPARGAGNLMIDAAVRLAARLC